MKRHSLFFKIDLVFTLAFGLAILLFFIALGYEKQRQDREMMVDVITIAKELVQKEIPASKLTLLAKNLNLILEDNTERIGSAELVRETQFGDGHLNLYRHEGIRWIELGIGEHLWTFSRREQPSIMQQTAGLAFVGLVGFLLILYWVIRRSLHPLKQIIQEIRRYGEGAQEIHTWSDREDEIALVGNEFQKAVEKIRDLQEARTLFLRNIMHELKTPLTKGRICIQFFDESPNRQLLEDVFLRLENLIEEMAEIEKLNTRNIDLERKTYRVMDIIDNAAELLFLDEESFDVEVENEMVVGDFKLLSIAYKNLIDNAIKYSPDHRLTITARDKQLLFCNQGEKFAHPFSCYIEPFFKELRTEEPFGKGFGLGLYITHEILKLHDMSLRYEYIDDGQNCLIIEPI